MHESILPGRPISFKQRLVARFSPNDLTLGAICYKMESRDIALERLVTEAEQLGADAVAGVRFTSNFIEDVVEVLAYGTAMKKG